MKLRHNMSLHQYSDKAVELMKESAVGKELKDSDGEVIGKIVEVNNTDNPKVLEFITEIEGGEYFNVLNEHTSMSTTGKKALNKRT